MELLNDSLGLSFFLYISFCCILEMRCGVSLRSLALLFTAVSHLAAVEGEALADGGHGLKRGSDGDSWVYIEGRVST